MFASWAWPVACVSTRGEHQGRTDHQGVAGRIAKGQGRRTAAALQPESAVRCRSRRTQAPGWWGRVHPLSEAKAPHAEPWWLAPAVVFDELEAEVRAKNGVWSQVRKRNESFDLCRMIRAGLLSLAVDKIKDWNEVPAWLAPLDKNSDVVSTEDRRAMKENEVVQQPVEPVVRVVAPTRRPRRRAYTSL